jgi:hypothetical protein
VTDNKTINWLFDRQKRRLHAVPKWCFIHQAVLFGMLFCQPILCPELKNTLIFQNECLAAGQNHHSRTRAAALAFLNVCHGIHDRGC